MDGRILCIDQSRQGKTAHHLGLFIIAGCGSGLHDTTQGRLEARKDDYTSTVFAQHWVSSCFLGYRSFALPA